MKIAVLSDIHDHILYLAKVLKKIENDVDTMVYCGDMSAPFTAGMLSNTDLKIHACLGNTDEDHIYMHEKGDPNIRWVPLGKEFGEIKLGNRKIAFNHYPKLGELLAKTGDYDAVFYGHTHVAVNKKIGKTLLLNPGAVCGIQGGKPGIATYAIYDTKTNSAKILEIE